MSRADIQRVIEEKIHLAGILLKIHVFNTRQVYVLRFIKTLKARVLRIKNNKASKRKKILE